MVEQQEVFFESNNNTKNYQLIQIDSPDSVRSVGYCHSDLQQNHSTIMIPLFGYNFRQMFKVINKWKQFVRNKISKRVLSGIVSKCSN